MLYTLGLAASLAAAFYLLIGGRVPEIGTARSAALNYGLPALSAALFFAVFSAVFQSGLVGAVWAVLGWVLPGRIIAAVEQRRLRRLQRIAKDFITAMGGLYAAGQTTTQAVNTCATRMPEPFFSALQEIQAQHRLNPHASYPASFARMGERFGLKELNALAAIVKASETAGGPPAAADGLKRLGRALRQRDRLRAERAKALHETLLTSYVIVGLLTVILFAHGLFGMHLFGSPAGKIVLAVSSAMIVGMILLTLKLSDSADIA